METNQYISPLSYFHDLLENDKSQTHIHEFISYFVNNSGHTILHIDNSKGIIKYLGSYYDEYGNQGVQEQINYDFYTFFQHQILGEIQKSKYLITTKIEQLAIEGKTYIEFLILQKRLLYNLKLKAGEYYKNYPFVEIEINNLISYLENYESLRKAKVELSYCWNSDNQETSIKSIIKLHLLLSNYHIIDSSIEEFINAFSKGEVINGVKWLALGKNRQINKRMLLYFINQLEKNSFISKISDSDYNKTIEYVFRDINGNFLKHVRQSKSNFQNLYTYAIIDNIISQLL